VVDDNQHFLAIAYALIVAQGHECLRAGSESEALEIVAREAPDCYVLDIRLGDWSPLGEKMSTGVDLFEEIKTVTGRRHVVFTSAHNDFEEEYLLRRGAASFIDKTKF